MRETIEVVLFRALFSGSAVLPAELLEVREVCRSVGGELYRAKVEIRKRIVSDWMKRLPDPSPLGAVPRIISEFDRAGAPLPGAEFMWLTAAAVELMEERFENVHGEDR